VDFGYCASLEQISERRREVAAGEEKLIEIVDGL
jgi:hypothetical protein